MFQPDFAARAVESRRGRWHQRIAEGTGSILVAELDGRPLVLSFCVSSSTRPGLAEIYSFYGHPDGWGSGAAAALMTETLRSLHESLSAIERDTSPFAVGKPPRAGVHWVEPRLVAQIAFAEWTPDALLRQPRFEGLRDDKDPAEVVRETPS